jgi:5-hydroxyisourate hydrolase-like protein (transthyretin family)
MSTFSVRVVDCTFGRPASGVGLRLERRDDRDWALVLAGLTADDGRLASLDAHEACRGRHQLIVTSSSYFAGLGTSPEYGDVAVGFHVAGCDDDVRLAIYLSAAAIATCWERAAS